MRLAGACSYKEGRSARSHIRESLTCPNHGVPQDWYSDCWGTVTRVDKDGKMCDVKWDDRDRPYHYHTGCSNLHHLILISNSQTARLPRVMCKTARSLACIRKQTGRHWKSRATLLHMR